MAAHYRRAGPSSVKDAGSAGAAEGGRFAILDGRLPPGTLAAKKQWRNANGPPNY